MITYNQIPRDQWFDIGERPRDLPPLMWLTYDSSPFTVAEACDLAMDNRLILMHRHMEDRVIATVYIPSSRAAKGPKKGTKKGGKGY
jgi:hypothetical protein